MYILQKLKWKYITQRGEKYWWENWLKGNNNDDAWLKVVLDYFNLKEKQDFGEKTIVDIGAGPIGILTKLKAKKRIVVDPLAVDNSDKKIIRIWASGEDIPLPDKSTSTVFIYNVLQHVISPEKVLEEGTRILKTGGIFYLLEQLNLPTDNLHPHSLKLEMFTKWITRYKFKIIKKRKEKDCCFDQPKVFGFGYSILCLILKKT